MKLYLKRQLLKFKYRNKCIFDSGTIISKKTIFEGMNKIGKNTHFDGKLGYGSYISAHCDIAMTEIGKFTSIGPRVVVNPGRISQLSPLYAPDADCHGQSYFSVSDRDRKSVV